MNFDSKLAEVAHRRHQQLYRQVIVNDAPTGREIIVDGYSYINFSSNDYLGLARHPNVVTAYQKGAQDYGVGSGGSPLVTGFQRPHSQLSEQLAQWLDYPQVMLLSSGFTANQLIIKTLMSDGDLLLQDKLNHASLIDAGLCCGAQMKRFLHNRADSLEKKLSTAEANNRLVVTEGVFSMDGDEAPLDEMARICKAHDAWLMVDDAHGIAVHGPQGRGSLAKRGVKAQLLMATFGKALGVGGSMIAASQKVIELLTNLGREYIYSTAMPAAQACAVSAAIKLVQSGEYQQRLHERIHEFKQQMKSTSWHVLPSDTAIQPLWVGSAEQALILSEKLRHQGIWVSAIRPPTVPPEQARLRITITAAHCSSDITRLTQALSRLQPVDEGCMSGY
ncbi:MAG: 8-amino-7-oxononanoate synthase [Candidatus Celerinatantimonas neptuna]|nr:MAG: 8-amino-7-oxononanoate synthase [Candidatus Celerinatantimonas neptuna]